MNKVGKWKELRRNAQSLASVDLKKLYMKDGLLAVVKPFGIPVHAGPKQKYSIVDLFPSLEHKYNIPAGSLELANRIDKDANGVLMLTYKREMAAYIADLQRKHLIEKEYLTVVVGSTQRTFGKLIGEVKSNRRLQVVDTDSKKSRDSVLTSYRILDNNKLDCMLCSFRTHHGQKHQIRVHASQLLGTPILGDHKYHHGPAGPQPLTLRMMQVLGMRGVLQKSGKGKIRPWQRGLIPLHLCARQVFIPGLSSKSEDGILHLEAPLPKFFKETLECLDLLENRQEIEDEQVARKWDQSSKMVVSNIVPRGPSPFHVNKETSL